jgi:predicted XRE-type DNA-binding protein
MTPRASPQLLRMRIDQRLKELLVRELCAILDGWDQTTGAAMVGIRQQDLSALRRGRGKGFSVGRLLRLIARDHYHVEVHLRRIPRPYAKPREVPTVTGIRYDRWGRPSSQLFVRPIPSAKLSPDR